MQSKSKTAQVAAHDMGKVVAPVVIHPDRTRFGMFHVRAESKSMPYLTVGHERAMSVAVLMLRAKRGG